MNQKIEKIQIGDLPTELKVKIQDEIKPYVIGLLGIYTGSAGEEVTLLGSGTLVQIRDKFGIITAKHLTDKFNKFKEIGINLGGFVHKCVIKTDYLRIVAVDTSYKNQIGPDLAFVIFPDVFVGTIKAKKVFWNISNHKKTVLSKPIVQNLSIRLWILTGTPEALSLDGGPTSGFDKTKICCFIIGFTGAEAYWIKEEFDYIRLSVLYKDPSDLPNTFKGVSGGGIWSTELCRSTDGIISFTNPLFLGVAIQETSTENNRRSIIAHGWRSIYEVVPNLMLKETA